ncbi:MAG: hypothetical protein ISS28_05255 [Candidatus Cloacimonetes bacterium]|nr:hypothetical protein [Candidatus Cloacimonadota bacterium]
MIEMINKESSTLYVNISSLLGTKDIDECISEDDEFYVNAIYDDGKRSAEDEPEPHLSKVEIYCTNKDLKYLKNLSWLEFCFRHNKKDFFKLIKVIDKLEERITFLEKADKDAANRLSWKLDRAGLLKKEFIFWFEKNGYYNWLETKLTEIQLLISNTTEQRKSKKDEYEELFTKYYKDDNADPVKVKNKLNNKEYWKNPSQYLHPTKRKLGLTTNQLKSRPGFTWIDPRNTSID